MVGLGPLLGQGASELKGKIESVTDSSVVLHVTEVTHVDGQTETWKGERASIPLREISSVATRRTSVARSVLLTGALAGAVYLVGHGFGGGNATGSQTIYGGQIQ